VISQVDGTAVACSSSDGEMKYVSLEKEALLNMRPDQAINFLQGLGYSVVSLPKGDLKPGQTLLRTNKKELTRLGDLSTIIAPGDTMFPALSTDNVAPTGISGKQSSSVDLDIGLNILGNILTALSGTSLSVDAGFKNNKSVTFAYQDVLEDHITLDQLDQYLSSSTLRPNQNMVRAQFSQNNVFVLVSAIKSKSISVNAQADNDVSGQVSVPVIQGIAGGSLKVDLSRAAQGQVTFTGANPVVFGFKAVQLFADANANYTVLKPAPDGTYVTRGAESLTDKDASILSLNGAGIFFNVADERTATAAQGKA